MAKKRKSDATTRLDEVDRTFFSSFCTAANSISQLYTQTQHQQKIAFHEGECHFVEGLCQWLKDQQRASIPIEYILQFLQDELENNNGDEMMSPSYQSQQISAHAMQQQPQSLLAVHQTASDIMGHSGLGHMSRSVPADQSKAYVFSSPLSSPNRRCLSPFVSTQGGHASVQSDSTASLARRAGNVLEQHTQHAENNDYYVERYNSNIMTSQMYACDPRFCQRRPTHPPGEHDTNMDMHADGNC